MNYPKRPFLLVLVASLFVNSCKNTNCNDPIAFNYDPEGTSADNCIYSPKHVDFTVTSVFSGNNFELGDTLLLADGRKITLSYYGVYLSNLSFKEASGDARQWSDNVVLVRNRVEDTSTTYLNKSQITALKFDVGVDSSIYKDDPSTLPSNDPLSHQIPVMFWTWASGYRYISVEGMVDTSTVKDGTGWREFAFHSGLPSNLHSIELTTPDSYSTASHIQVSITMNIAALLEGLDFENPPFIIHNGNEPKTIAIANNSVNAFTLD
ncbi:MAG: MbnP family protein [Flavobacteriales bacterium]